MFDDPTFDGKSYMIVGDRLLEAARERPTLGLALGRDRAPDTRTRAWFVGTRVAAPSPAERDVRFEGDAPPLAALAQRMEAGEFGRWFEAVKAGVDSGRLQPLRLPPGEALARPRSGKPPAPPTPAQMIEQVDFELVAGVPPLRCRSTRR